MMNKDTIREKVPGTSDNVGISLIENSKGIARNIDGDDNSYSGELMKNLILEGEKFKIGKIYPEEVAVYNSGTLDQYCRLIIYKRWRNAKGEIENTLSSDLIELNVPQGNGWILDKNENVSNTKRIVMYYNKTLPAGATSTNAIDTIQISPEINNKVTQTSTKTDSNGNKTITTSYAYNGCTFEIIIEVDTVTTDGAQDKIKSDWGVDVNIDSDGTLSLQ